MPVGQAPRCDADLHVSMSAAEADGIAAACQALSSPARVRLVALLRDCPCGAARAGDLAERTGYSAPVIDHHLQALIAGGLVLADQYADPPWFTLDADRLRLVLTLLGGPPAAGH